MDTAVPRPAALEVRHISRSFGKTNALNGLSTSAEGGQVVGLLGRNGAGKSTLLRVISDQLRPNEGESEIFGSHTNSAAALGRLCLIGDSPDFGRLVNMMSLFYVCAGLFPLWDGPYALELARRFELPVKKRLKGFSRGMQTAVLLAVGLASGAPLTIFDEPSLGLDAVMRERFYDQLLEDKRKNPERTFILSTHLIDEVARTLDYAILIDAGTLLYEGPVSDLVSRHLSVSGPAAAVREVTQGFAVLKEEEMAGALVRHIRLNHRADAEGIRDETRVQSAPLGLQRLFVFLTEEKEAARHETTA